MDSIALCRRNRAADLWAEHAGHQEQPDQEGRGCMGRQFSRGKHEVDGDENEGTRTVLRRVGATNTRRWRRDARWGGRTVLQLAQRRTLRRPGPGPGRNQPRRRGG
jgi:hypothetical protein